MKKEGAIMALPPVMLMEGSILYIKKWNRLWISSFLMPYSLAKMTYKKCRNSCQKLFYILQLLWPDLVSINQVVDDYLISHIRCFFSIEVNRGCSLQGRHGSVRSFYSDMIFCIYLSFSYSRNVHFRNFQSRRHSV